MTAVELRARPKLYMALPTYDGSRYNMRSVLNALYHPGPFEIGVCERASSLLAWSFNSLWAEALEERAKGVTHFLLMHSDVRPLSPTWLEELTRVMIRTSATVLSFVLPIKDRRGLTSTAIDGGIRGKLPRARRLTVEELSRDFPSTFTASTLLVNTGLLLIDVRAPWVERVSFSMRDTIERDEAGRRIAITEPEDWRFSRQVRACGVPLWVTREIQAMHYGGFDFPNAGDWRETPEYMQSTEARERAIEQTGEMTTLYDAARKSARAG